jgi:membrane-bound ClpP family serine protease
MIFTVYLICLCTGFFFTMISALAGHVFGHTSHVVGSHGSAEAGADSSDAPGVSIFSPLIVAAFVAAFGGFGIIFSQIRATREPLVSAPLSILGAFCIAAVLIAMLRWLFSHTQSSSEAHVGELTGVCGNIISPIPENGVGEIAYVQGGSRYSAPAREVNGKPVAAGQTVQITKIVGSQFYVAIVK